jgi:hypothetical protein
MAAGPIGNASHLMSVASKDGERNRWAVLRRAADGGSGRDDRDDRDSLCPERAALSPESQQWIITAYGLAFGSLLLLGGKLGDEARHGRRIVSQAAR